MKTCAKCGVEKPKAEFYRDRSKAEGIRNECKDCTKSRLRAYRESNREREIARGRYNYAKRAGKPIDEATRVEFDGTLRRRSRLAAFAQKHRLQIDFGKHCSKCGEWKPINQFKRRGRGDQRRSDCNACVKLYVGAAYQADPERMRARARAWTKANPEKNRRQSNARRAMKLGAPGNATPGKLGERRALYGGKCYLCGQEATEMDHVKPLTKGGGDWPSNQRPACRSCNSSKYNEWPYPIPAGPFAALSGGG